MKEEKKILIRLAFLAKENYDKIAWKANGYSQEEIDKAKKQLEAVKALEELFGVTHSDYTRYYFG